LPWLLMLRLPFDGLTCQTEKQLLVPFRHLRKELEECPFPGVATCGFSDLGGHRFAFALIEKLVQLKVERREKMAESEFTSLSLAVFPSPTE